MKVFVLAPKEDWICDRFVSEWYESFPGISTRDPREADVIWLLADWAWNQLPLDLLKSKKVLTSVHHLVPEKFGPQQLAEFKARDEITDFYHVPCELTRTQVSDVLTKIGSKKNAADVWSRPFWVNARIWKPYGDIASLREQYVGKDEYPRFLVGSFQRDTEGHDLISPKLEKGPDIFCDMVEALHREKKNVEVVLGGWRRQYVMNRLDRARIPFYYFERPPFSQVNDLYHLLDLYIVAARYEGGPQAIMECAATHTPIVSTRVGFAPEILHSDALYDPSDVSNFLDAASRASADKVLDYNFGQAFPFFIPFGFGDFTELLQWMTDEMKP